MTTLTANALFLVPLKIDLSVGKGCVQWVFSTRVLDEHKENSFYNRFQVVVLVVTFSLLKGEQRRGGQV